MVDPFVALPKLRVERRPRKSDGAASGYAMKPISKPSINIERQRAMREPTDVVLVQWNGVRLEALPIFEGESDCRRPQNALAVVLGKPEVEGRDNLRVDGYRVAIFRHAEPSR